MSLETRKVLEMVAEGKISAEDGERLLGKLNASEAENVQSEEAAPGDENAAKGAKAKKHLRIVVQKPGHDPINVRLPISFLRAQSSMAFVMLPNGVREQLAEKGIDLNGLGKMKGAELDQYLENLNVDVDRGARGTVKIFCE